MDDLIFSSLYDSHFEEFVRIMSKKFQMSMFGNLHFFLGLQETQNDKGIFVTQSKYAENLVKKFGLAWAKERRTPVRLSN